MNLHRMLLQRAADRQAAPHRPDRRRQVRLDVPGAGPAHAGRASGRHRRSLAAARAREPGARRLEARASRGRLARRGASRTATPILGDDWQALVAPSGDRHRRRMHRPSDRRGRALPGGLRARQARGQCHGRGRRLLRPAAGAQGGRGRRDLQPGLRRPAGADLRPGRLGAHLRASRWSAAGRGHKWLPHFAQSTPETVWGYYGLTPEQAKRGGLNPKMFNCFLDGSKPAIESTAVANATGLTPAPDGLLYPARSRRGHSVRDAAASRRRRARITRARSR